MKFNCFLGFKGTEQCNFKIKPIADKLKGKHRAIAAPSIRTNRNPRGQHTFQPSQSSPAQGIFVYYYPKENTQNSTGIVGGGSSIIQTELVRLSKVSALFVHSCKSGCAMLTLKLHNQPRNRLIILHLISQLQHKRFSTKPQPCRSVSDGEEMNSNYLWKFSCFRMATWAFWF